MVSFKSNIKNNYNTTSNNNFLSLPRRLDYTHNHFRIYCIWWYIRCTFSPKYPKVSQRCLKVNFWTLSNREHGWNSIYHSIIFSKYSLLKWEDFYLSDHFQMNTSDHFFFNLFCYSKLSFFFPISVSSLSGLMKVLAGLPLDLFTLI